MNKNLPSIAVIGPGAIGLSLATDLTKAGHDVVLCDSRHSVAPFELEEAGIVTQWDLKSIQNPEELLGCDIGIIAVKTHQTSSIAHWLKAFDRPEAILLAAQNGVEQYEQIGQYAPKAQIIPAIVYINGERPEPRKFIIRKVVEQELILPDDEPSQKMADILRAAGLRIVLSDDFLSLAWKKLLRNIVANPITALTVRKLDVMRDPAIAELAHAILLEAIEVGRAEGAVFSEDEAGIIINWLQDLPDGIMTSMWQDRLACRPLEYDALTGAIIRAAERHDIPVPFNRMILALLANIRPDKA